MKLQFEILFFIMCVNLAVGILISINAGGINEIQPTTPYSDPLEVEEQFNATALAEEWSSQPFSGMPILGDLFAGFDFLFRNARYLIDGFPFLLDWIRDNFITDASTRVGFNLMANALRALYGILFTWWVIEFISGRVMTK